MFVGIVKALYSDAAEYTSGYSGLEIGCRIRSTSRVMVLLEVALERRVCSSRCGLVAKSGPGVEVEVIIVRRDALLAAPHAPAYEGNATKQKGTSYTADYSADNALLFFREAAAGAFGSLLSLWWVSDGRLTCSDKCSPRCNSSHFLGLAIDDSEVCCGELLHGRYYERRGINDCCCTERRTWRIAGLGGWVVARWWCAVGSIGAGGGC
jgi:hypothetical protein